MKLREFFVIGSSDFVNRFIQILIHEFNHSAQLSFINEVTNSWYPKKNSFIKFVWPFVCTCEGIIN